MLGLLVVCIVSWLILWFFSKEHITALGISPTGRRLTEFSMGLVFMAVLCAINLVGQAYLQDIRYVLNADFSVWDGLEGIWWTFKSALFEELVFRGAILYMLIKKIGTIKACVIDAIAFGVYHWFSYGMFGGPLIPMIYIFLLTGASGWMFAYAFARTKSLYAPMGLHFGWILVSIVVFSQGPLGDQLLFPRGEAVDLSGWATLVFFLLQAVAIPGVVIWYLAKKYAVPHSEKSAVI